MGHYTASMKRVREIGKRLEGRMNWTRERPTQAGWYWWRGSAGVALPLLVLNSREYQRWIGDSTWSLDKMADGEFQGPLTPNEATE